MKLFINASVAPFNGADQRTICLVGAGMSSGSNGRDRNAGRLCRQVDQPPGAAQRYGVPRRTPAESAVKGTGPRQAARACCAFLESPPVTPAHLPPRVSVAVLVSWPTRPCQNVTKAGGIVKLKIDTAGGATNVTNSPGQRGAEMPTVPGKSLCEHL
jgi:hypothetical protein